jgi:GntR family transcriptional regulator
VILHLRPDSPVPPYEQLRDQIATMVASGALAPGTRLPSIRQLAADLGLAVGTVGRAFRELEHEGVIVSRGRHGTFTQEPATPPAADRDARLADAARSYAIAVRQLGATPDQGLEAAGRALAELPEEIQTGA